MTDGVIVHEFAGMDVDTKTDDDGRLTRPRRYRGRCQCGHADPWTEDKDGAWNAIADHMLPHLLAGIAAARPGT